MRFLIGAFRSVPVLAVAALVAIACAKIAEPEPDRPGSRLVGTWEADPLLDPQLAKYADRAKAKSESQEQGEERELPLHFTFARDGEYTMEGSVFGHPIKETCQWKVLSEVADDITVELVEPDKPSSSMKISFNSPDVIVMQFNERSRSYLKRLR